jgi:hypothetical protein
MAIRLDGLLQQRGHANDRRQQEQFYANKVAIIDQTVPPPFLDATRGCGPGRPEA